MANKTLNARIVNKHDTEANWAKATNFTPLQGEIVVYDSANSTPSRFKIGNGSSKVGALPFVSTLPNVTTSNNGQFLRVVSGAWAATTVPNAEDNAF